MFFSSRRRHTSLVSDWSSDVCSSDLAVERKRIERGLGALEAVLAPSPLVGARRRMGASRKLGHRQGADGEIGRAAWRARGWEWGVSRSDETTVVLGAMKA